MTTKYRIQKDGFNVYYMETLVVGSTRWVSLGFKYSLEDAQDFIRQLTDREKNSTRETVWES